jgi:aspartate/methionine/tyrosine aminotransferase
MRYSDLVERVAGEGADAWNTHYAATAARERGEDVVILSIGDPDIDTPRAVIDRAIERLEAGDTHYTPIPGRERLREAIARRHRERTGQNAEAANVMFCSGAQNALFSASMCLAGPGDEVIALEPLYPTYPATLQVTGARMVRVRAPAESGFRVDLAGLESAISARTRAIFFATPNNPSGVIVNDEEMTVIGELARRHSLWVVTDEVYAGLAPTGRVPGLAARLPEQTVTVASLSKTHAMPGWRAGWMVAPKELIEHVEELGLAMLYGLPGFIQEAALTAIGIAEQAEERTRDICARRRDFVLAALAGVPQIRCMAPAAGMFLLIDVRGCGLSGHEFMTELYREERVSILDGGAFGRDTADFVRLCFATDEASLREACVRIRRFAQRRH